MLKKSSNNNNKNIFSETTNIAKEKMICKDGFCSLPNQDEIPKQDTNDLNLFDPIQKLINFDKLKIKFLMLDFLNF